MFFSQLSYLFFILWMILRWRNNRRNNKCDSNALEVQHKAAKPQPNWEYRMQEVEFRINPHEMAHLTTDDEN